MLWRVLHHYQYQWQEAKTRFGVSRIVLLGIGNIQLLGAAICRVDV